MDGNSLLANEVDRALIAFDNAGATGGSLQLGRLGGNNAALSAVGIIAKNNLIGKGWTVATN